MKMQVTKRLLSLLLAVALLAGFAVPLRAAGGDDVAFTKVDNGTVSASLLPEPVEDAAEEPQYADTDVVRVSIMLEKASTLEAGFSTHGIADSRSAMTYRSGLKKDQAAVTARIEQTTGEKLDVAWNLTLAANIISANVEYGQLASISRIPGVRKVVLETRYEPQTATTSAVDKPNMLVSANMTGAVQVWESGYTGAGTRVAIIDTGLDTDHQSFDPGALVHALAEDAQLAGMSYEEYLAHVDVLDEDELAEKLPQLNVAERNPELTAEDLYFNLKAPFAYNYLDLDLDVTHDNDSASEHGSHVAGIAAANRFIKEGSGYVSAADAVGTVGNAPDAQILTMKVFGKMGGAYDSDYMAAIEDAIILGCDAVNLSLGSSSAGFTTSEDYEDLLDYLTETDCVVAMASGNSGYWTANAAGPMPNLYVEDVNFQTAGSPSTYTNAFAVASVDNDGAVGPSLQVGGSSFGYGDGTGETGPGWNNPMATLDTTGEGTQYDYVFLNSIGLEEDYAGIDVTGKIVFVSRGETNFADKANVAVDMGAIATVVYNNEPGTINMILTGYYEEAPCVLITQASGNIVREHSTAATTDRGVTYYTGKVTVESKVKADIANSDYYHMSSFSSWGVPGDLSMKPEITAPGGNIYSVNGAVSETDQYEMMSGTSMATPQITGISALVQQVIREKGLSQPGLTDRALTQSLLMSTAVPLKDANGLYYSVLQQGAGLADVLAATSASSYVTVDGQPDGKVKVELGDDPARAGVYSFSFHLNNLSDEEKTFQLSADMFTQDTFEGYANEEAANAKDDSMLVSYLDTATRNLGCTAAWEADGAMVSSPKALEGCDFDGDGDVDKDDAQALLDYVTGARSTISSLEHADVSGDEDVDTYDVHVFLAKLSGGAVNVPAGGSVKVTVTLTLDAGEKAYLDAHYPNGAYLQAYVYADAVTDAEGVDGTCHSIPVLGFYGNWTDPSMFEIGTTQELATGNQIRTPYTGIDSINSMMVEYARDPGYSYCLGGNPVVADETYMPQRNAINNQNGDRVYSVQFNPIRNVAASRIRVTNATTGEQLKEVYLGSFYAPYYSVILFFETWLEAIQSYKLKWVPKELAEGETFEVSVTLAPEYYVDGDTVNWDALGKGATRTMQATIDNTPPEIQEVSLGMVGNTLTVDARDNQYVAGVALFNSTGSEVLAYTGSNADAVPGETGKYTLSLDKANGNKFLLQVYDYAYNVTTYELKADLGQVPALPPMIAYDRMYNSYWTSFNLDSWYRDLNVYAKSETAFNAATIDSHYVFACSVDGDLYVMPENDLADMTRIRNLGTVLCDMAYSRADDSIYAVAYSDSGESVLYTVNKLDGTLTEVGTLGLNTNTLACDLDGVFYCNEYGTSKVYSFTLDTLDQPKYLMECVNDNGEAFTSMGAQAMEYDVNTGNVVWISYYFQETAWGTPWGYSYLYEIHPKTNTYTLHNDLFHQLTALVIPQRSAGGSWTAPTDQVTSLELSQEKLTLLKGNSDQLTANVLPWTATDRSVTWSSADTSVATVNQYGVVTGVDPGTTTITAVSNLDPSFTAKATVTVEALPITVEGVLQTEEGAPVRFTWDMTRDNTWTAGIELDTDVLAATHNGKGTMYVTSGDGKTMRSVDMETGVSAKLSTWANGLDDLAYSKLFSTQEQDLVHFVCGSVWAPAKDPSNMEDDEGWDLSSYIYQNSGGSQLLAIAEGGSCTYTEVDGIEHEAEILYFVDDKGWICKLYAYEDGDFYNAGMDYYPSNLTDAGYEATMDENSLVMCSLLVEEDGNLYFSGWNGKTNVFYKLTFQEETQAYEAIAFANVGEDVWPASLLEVKSNAATTSRTNVPASGDSLAQCAQRVSLSAAGEKAVQKENTALMTFPMAEDALASKEARLTPAAASPLPQEATAAEDVVVTLTAKDAEGNALDVTNGLFRAAYDPEKLTLKSVESDADLTSTVTASGSVTFGYAGVTPIPTGNAVAKLVFTPKASGTTDVTITTTQINDTKVEMTETVTATLPEIPVCEHASTEIRGAKEATCTEDGYTGDEVCTVCGEIVKQGETIPALGHKTELRNAKEATCTEDGYTGDEVCTVCGETVKEGQVIPANCPSKAFADLNTDRWYHEYTDYVIAKGLMNGMDETHFAPEGSLTRGQLVTTLYRLAGEPEVAEPATFADVKAGRYYTEAVAWAEENGIAKGITDTTFCPDKAVTREQAATFLYRYVTEYLEQEPATGADLSIYTDREAISKFARTAVAWATAEGFLQGFPGGSLQPRGTLTRAQMAKLLTILDQKF